MSDGEDNKPILTPEQAAEGWIVQNQGGIWVKTLDLSKVTRRIEIAETNAAFLAGEVRRQAARAEAAEAKLERLKQRVERNFVHTRDSLRELLEEP